MNIAVSVEAQFAEALEASRLAKDDPFVVVTDYKTICAKNALALSTQLEDTTEESDARQEFDNWDLETRLWHLVQLLYQFRHSVVEQPLPEYEFSSYHVKKENWLRQHPKVREVALIIHWLHENSRTVATDDELRGRWVNTQHLVKNPNHFQELPLVQELDADAALRSGKGIHQDDIANESKVYSLIYKLVLANKFSEAIDIANTTHNYTLALILVGARQDYIDPIVDKETLGTSILDDSIDEIGGPSGLKHKLLWYKTVYKLAQQDVNPYEKLIYAYLSGNDIRENLKAAADWEEHLLLYLNQLLAYEITNFVTTTLSEDQRDAETIAFPSIVPQNTSVNSILNALSKADTEVSEQSTHPLRVITGSVMINQVASFLNNITKNKDLLANTYLLRIVTHLALLLSSLGDDIPSKTITKVVTLYVGKLQELRLVHLIPLYLSFIPDEKDARETYSLFLSSIVEPDQRAQQIRIAKKFAQFNSPSDDGSVTLATDDFEDDKMVNLFRRTVERVMTETEPFYRFTGGEISVQNDGVSDVDARLFRAVDWFYEGKMYEDAITATLVVMRRFLLNGKLASVKAFAKGKNFKALIRDFDAEYQTRAFSSSPITSVTDDSKEELLQYNALVEVLTLIDDWKNFLASHKVNGLSSAGFWKSPDLKKSIDKTTSEVLVIIHKWLTGLIESSSEDKLVFVEFRAIYVPYLIMELLSIYEVSRLNDWFYMQQAFKLVSEVARDDKNDFLGCFVHCGRLDEFVRRSAQIAVVASERGLQGIFHT